MSRFHDGEFKKFCNQVFSRTFSFVAVQYITGVSYEPVTIVIAWYTRSEAW